MASIRRSGVVWISLIWAGLPQEIHAEPVPQELLAGLHWRMIGPFRGGRTVAATGIPGQPNVFFIGVCNGGVWRTNDYGRTWKPIFDDQPTGSIGALAVAPSDPRIIYVGSGEGLQRPDLSVGDGIYKSTDNGKTWQHKGLRDGQQIGAILVHPRDPNRVYVAVLGHPYGANTERGVYRSTDGGASWERVLYKDENTGAIALAFDPSNPDTLYADLWAGRQGPWENGEWQGSGSGLYKSTDGGTSWRHLTKGLPTPAQGLGRIGFGIAPSDPRRMYATVDAGPLGGIYRSDDAGESWRRTNPESRLWSRGDDFAEIKVDPKHPDIVYVANTSTYRSTDGAATFSAFKGAPGGDDYHTIWINPDHPEIILLASDQGAIITVNGGETWSSWYNQPTAQFYHVITDHQFPYWVYGGQQESGSAGVASRGPYGQITFRDWKPVGVEEYGYVAPDPLHPNIIYGGAGMGGVGRVTRFDRTTGQTQDVTPEAVHSGKYRFLRTMPLIFAPTDPHTLYFGSNVLFKTTSGGQTWEIISPDLSRPQPEVPASIGIYRTPELARMPRRGVIYTVAPSPRDGQVIWAGTDDGLIHRTTDGGKTWKEVTPPALTPWSKVSLIDAGHFDAQTAYAAVNRFRLDDLKPHIYRTHDGGQSWQEIVRGLPERAPVNAVREDPERRGLLFAATELAVYFSSNDGEDWQSLRLNMPATSIRDVVVHDTDLVVGTHGRSFWILDNITPLRQIDAAVTTSAVRLFPPAPAIRVRNNVNTDTPLPGDEPTGQNPPEGAMIDFWLRTDAPQPVVLEILDAQGRLVRRFTSADAPEPVNARELDIPTYWIRPPRILPGRAGMHRFVWDLHYPPPPGVPRGYPIAAVVNNTPSEPRGPWVLPGTYTAKLTVGSISQTQPLIVKMDPRVRTPMAGLEEQFQIAHQAWEGLTQLQSLQTEVRAARTRVEAELKKRGEAKEAAPLTTLEQDLAALIGEPPRRRRPGRSGAAGSPSLGKVQGELTTILNLVEAADAAPTSQMKVAATAAQQQLRQIEDSWKDLHRRLEAAVPADASGRTSSK